MKKMNEMTIRIVTLAIALLHSIAACILTARLPETVPTHFDMNWVCDGVGSKWNVLFVALLPVLIGVSSLVWCRFVKARNLKITAVILLYLTVFFAVLFWVLYPLMASGAQVGDAVEPLAMRWAMPLIYAVLFIAIGNYMPVIEPNRYLGIKLGWTLNNEQCWRVTHRFAGRLWVVTGLFMTAVICISLAAGLAVGAWLYILFAIMFIANIAVPCVFAWKHKDDGKEQSHA